VVGAELWRRFTIALRRKVAHHLGLSETAARGLVRVQFAKVAEFQRRGIIHFHALIRLDGPPSDSETYPAPAVDLDSQTLAGLVRAAAAAIYYDAPPVDGEDIRRRLRFGVQLDARSVTGTADRDTHSTSCTRRPWLPTSLSTPPKLPATYPQTSKAETDTWRI
jgi:hypothetical protein